MIPQPIDQVPLFQKLSHEEREVLTGRFRHYTYEPNNVIFSAGKPSELLGVVVSGLVKLESESPNGPLVLVNLGAGSVLGEVDCLLKRPASTTARAGSPLDLLVLSRADLEDILIQHPTIGLKFSAALGTRIAYLDEYLATQRLAVLPLFSGLSEESLYAMASRLEFRIFGRGESLFENGSDGEFLFLIESGRVRVVAETAQGEEFSEWHEGDLLGQQAIVTGKPYGATAFALSDLQSWVLSRTAYIELIKNHPAIKLAFSRALSEKLDADEQGRAVAQLGNLALFSDLDTTVLASLANHLVLRHYPAGEWIYTRGTPGDAIYFVDSGEIRLYPDSDLERYLERKTIGTSFGEMALLTGRTRTEAARAQTDTTLWVLYKADYDNLLVQHPTLSLALTRALSARLSGSEGAFEEKHLQHIKLFNGLSQNELREISAHIQPAKFRAGEVVCYAGQPLTNLYLIESGQVEALFQTPAGVTNVLEELGPGDSFGEAALLQNTAQNYTVQAVTDLDVWTIRKADFDRLLAQYSGLTLNVTRRVAEHAHQVTERLTLATAAAPSPTVATTMPAPRSPVRQSPTPATRPQSPPPQTIVRPPLATQPNVPNEANPNNGGNGKSDLNGNANTLTNGAQGAPGVRTVPPRPWDKKNGNIMRPMPAAVTRPVQLKQNGNGAGTSSVAETGSNVSRWFGSMSGVAKIQIAAVVLLLAVTLCVVVPYAVFSVAQNFGGASSNASPKELPQNVAPEQRQSAGYALKIAKVETPTPTVVPPTKVPPTATAVPTKKPAVIAAAPSGNNPASLITTNSIAKPTPAGVAAAASVKAPPLPPVQWDPRLGVGGLPLLQGIHLEKASVGSGQKFWMATIVKYEDIGESGNDHTIYIKVLDEDGRRIEDATAIISWDETGGGQVNRLTPSDEKPAGDFCDCNYNWPMYGAGYAVSMEGLPSDKVAGMIMPMKRHVNYRLTFQRFVMP